MPGAVAASLLVLVSANARTATSVGELGADGLWNCIVYGDPVRGDQRTVLLLTPERATYMGRQRSSTVSPLRRLDDWTLRGSRLRFVDPQSQREFSADLRSLSLGGRWVDGTREGGWWCAKRPETVMPSVETLGRPSPDWFVPQIIPDRMFSPGYPIEAIRKAIEGRSVVCFLVDSTGAVVDPEVVEVTDEIFEQTTLRAISRSRYRPTAGTEVDRPGCRQYRFELRVLHD